MLQRDKAVLNWSAVIGAILCGVSPYFLIVYSPWFVIMGTVIGSIMGIVWGKFALGELNRIPRIWFLGLIATLIGLFAATIWTLSAGSISHWFDGWAFPVWIGACLICMLLGLLSGLVGAVVLKRFLPIETSIKSKNTIFFVIVAVSLLFLIVIPLLLLVFDLPAMWGEASRVPLKSF